MKNLFHDYQVFKNFDDFFYQSLTNYSKIEVFTEGDILQVNSYVFVLLQGIINLNHKRTRKTHRQFVDRGIICTSKLLDHDDPDFSDVKNIFFECNSDNTVVIKINLIDLESLLNTMKKRRFLQ
mmetsp:Transcript_12471/g.9069  ORF Transcript_12471/g.9069 Transcript_12471/m.9069 type:complete len:124 (+) Transcript_12471:937-1308(+)